jgi:hypothetical protein
VWTNNKAFKSRRKSDPNCERCGDAGTMEHLLCECMHYSVYSQLIYQGETFKKYVLEINLPRLHPKRRA